TTPSLNEWGLSGTWTVGAEAATLDAADGGITYRFSARDLHLVLGPASAGKPVRFQVTIEGHPPGADHGADTDAEGNGVVT
ncbi:cytochrome c biogenesis protein DipZ, partial [Pseudomonas sp. MOB-449]|nr:cytochrome c biogenesis protein DipZ [Pseudomonas sp. MOB-449]